MRDNFSRGRRHFWVINYIVIFFLTLSVSHLGFNTTLPFTLAAVAGYALTYMLPLMLLVWLAKHLPAGKWIASLLAVAGMGCLLILLYTDKTVFEMYGFHLNGFVWNLITTPGGIASLESSRGTYVTVIALCIGIFIAELLLYAALARFASPQPAATPRWLKGAITFIVLCMIGERAAYGLSHFNSYRPILVAAQDVPFYAPTTFAHFLQDLGYEPARQSTIKIAGNGRLQYPLHPIKLKADAASPNIVWLACESLRWDMLTPEIMPNLWKFAQNNWRYTDHISGGNGTRWGIFTMFYGIPASYWFSFLDARRSPVLVDTLQKKGYQFGLYTSAKFTYPEFDKTIWANLPSSLLHADDNEVGWKDDAENVKRLNHFIDSTQKTGKPFLGFMFFESSHARYFFPKDAVIRKDYLKNFNYATVNLKKDIGLIKNRYINSSHALDRYIGRVLDNLKAEGLLKNTIVIVTGDHGEEFMEHGRWGHNSAFVNQQIHTPMVLHVPGRGARVVNDPTSHLDIVPTLMPLLGVTNPPSDYSVDAVSLLTPTKDRFRVIGSWNALGFVGNKYKISMPMNLAGMGYMEVTDANDAPVADPDAVIAQEKPKLMQLLGDISRFYRK